MAFPAPLDIRYADRASQAMGHLTVLPGGRRGAPAFVYPGRLATAAGVDRLHILAAIASGRLAAQRHPAAKVWRIPLAAARTYLAWSLARPA